MASYLSVEDLEEGMELSEPILNSFGQVLIPEGATISERHINVLKTWNIKTVAVKSDEEEVEAEISEELKQLCMSKVQERIKWQPRNAHEKDLINMAVMTEIKSIDKKSA
ncbi:MAG: hypothetical protein QG635_277 [Bacteroidota bacterium]|nr:hypothetical protein [Bacteroidota bacterium]